MKTCTVQPLQHLIQPRKTVVFSFSFLPMTSCSSNRLSVPINLQIQSVGQPLVNTQFTSTSNRRCFRCTLQLHFSVRRESNECGNCTVLAERALQYTHKGAGARIACIFSYQIMKETTSMQCRDQLSHEVTKKAIKAAIKLCMHVICYIWVTLRTSLWNGFQNCPGTPQHPSNTLDSTRQLIRRDWNGSEKVELRENTMRVRSVSHSQGFSWVKKGLRWWLTVIHTHSKKYPPHVICEPNTDHY